MLRVFPVPVITRRISERDVREPCLRRAHARRRRVPRARALFHARRHSREERSCHPRASTGAPPQIASDARPMQRRGWQAAVVNELRPRVAQQRQQASGGASRKRGTAVPRSVREATPRTPALDALLRELGGNLRKRRCRRGHTRNDRDAAACAANPDTHTPHVAPAPQTSGAARASESCSDRRVASKRCPLGARGALGLLTREGRTLTHQKAPAARARLRPRVARVPIRALLLTASKVGAVSFRGAQTHADLEFYSAALRVVVPGHIRVAGRRVFMKNCRDGARRTSTGARQAARRHTRSREGAAGCAKFRLHALARNTHTARAFC